MRDYTITLRRSDTALIKNGSLSERGRYALLEVSCDVDRQKFAPKLDYKGTVESWSYRLLRSEDDAIANWQGYENAARLVGDDALNDAKKVIRKSIKSLRVELRKGKAHPAYAAMLSIAQTTIKHFTEDFSWNDVLTLSRMPDDQPFVWLVRECGTWLLNNKSEFGREIVTYELKEKQHTVYFWDGSTLAQMERSSISEACNTLPDAAESR
jgi:hypothetical protein